MNRQSHRDIDEDGNPVGGEPLGGADPFQAFRRILEERRQASVGGSRAMLGVVMLGLSVCLFLVGVVSLAWGLVEMIAAPFRRGRQ